MSRYEYPGLSADITVAIGWDRPLQTFFVQVVKQGPSDEPTETEMDDEPQTLVWLGTHPNELPYASDAIRVARHYGDLPKDIGLTLETDRLRTVAETDGPAQDAARPFLSED